MKFLLPFLVVASFIFVVTRPNIGDQISSLFTAKADVVAAASDGAAHYSPSENLEALDFTDIVHSRCDHLDIAMYSFTDWKLAEAVIQFADSGHQVRIYRDREQYEQEMKRNSRVITMFHGNRNISIRIKASNVLMHVKSWSNGCVLRDGSANWSPSGEKEQDNTLTLTANPTAVAAFEDKFNLMWNRTNNLPVQ